MASDGCEPLPFRVPPFEPEQSILYKRITEHFLPNFERMPSSGNPLAEDKINLITNWINDGAKGILEIRQRFRVLNLRGMGWWLTCPTIIISE